ncbi:SMI1/KNR4 family protein [Spirillospora sp. NPDC029432]|uniref:SMI1/KNR4 family protein n=1 Tax=Spirillospora sp. NPDC029432 TaxID=3154599 RepID=UPI0034551235
MSCDDVPQKRPMSLIDFVVVSYPFAIVRGMEWESWLRRWSEEWIRATEPDRLDPEVVRRRWLGFDPADEAAVAAAEERLGCGLPPSYRDFLLTTDGWRDAGMFVWRMRDTGNLAWLRDAEPHWEIWVDLDEDDPPPEDGDWFTRGLAISLEADAGVLFLDSGDVDEDGEWAAYSLFSWRAQPPTRYPSFRALMESLYAQFHSMRRPEGETRESWEVKVEQARIDALSGDFEGAEAALEAAERFGIERATVLLDQLLCFLGKPSPKRWLMYPSPESESLLDDPMFTEELLPLLFAEHARMGRPPGHSNIPHEKSSLQMALNFDQPRLELLVAEYQWRLRRPGHRLRYGEPEFDARIHAALDRHAGDPDALWEAVRDALPHWRPRSPDHIAPVVLLADPVLAELIDERRGRELLSIPRGDR